MSGYTENSIIINRPVDLVFDLTNQIEIWPSLFTEYESAEILERTDNTIKFRLTTYATEERPSRTWVSIRTIDKQNRKATATRLNPCFPFSWMSLRWNYDIVNDNQSVLMTWIQEFEVHPDCKLSTDEMENFLNNNSKIQMASVKEKIEAWKS